MAAGGSASSAFTALVSASANTSSALDSNPSSASRTTSAGSFFAMSMPASLSVSVADRCNPTTWVP